MVVSDQLRETIIASAETHYHIGKETGIDTRALDRFIRDRKHIRTDTADKLCEYFNLELVKKKQKKSAKQATKRRSPVDTKRPNRGIS